MKNSIIVLGLMFMAGCASTHTISMRYEPTITPPSAVDEKRPISVGNFLDKRGTDSRWVGAIRGGYGNVLKRLLSDAPTSEVVKQAIVDALQARGVEVPTQAASIVIEGEILKLDCSYFFNREAHANLLVNVVSMPGRSTLYSQTYRTDNTESGVGAGIFGNVDHLAEFERRTLNETIDKIFADSALMEAIRSFKDNPRQAAGGSVEDRLRALEKLKSDGLVTEEEYQEKRR